MAASLVRATLARHDGGRSSSTCGRYGGSGRAAAPAAAASRAWSSASAFPCASDPARASLQYIEIYNDAVGCLLMGRRGSVNRHNGEVSGAAAVPLRGMGDVAAHKRFAVRLHIRVHLVAVCIANTKYQIPNTKYHRSYPRQAARAVGASNKSQRRALEAPLHGAAAHGVCIFGYACCRVAGPPRSHCQSQGCRCTGDGDE